MNKIAITTVCGISLILWLIIGVLVIWIPLLITEFSYFSVTIIAGIISQNSLKTNNNYKRLNKILSLPQNGFENIKNAYNNNSSQSEANNEWNYYMIVYRMLLPVLFYGLIYFIVK